MNNRIDVILPSFIFAEEYGPCLMEMFKDEREKFHDRINIVGFYGSYNTYWDSENHQFRMRVREDIETLNAFCRDYNLKLFYTYNNPFINDYMVDDLLSNNYLKISDKSMVEAFVSSPDLNKHLKNNGYITIIDCKFLTLGNSKLEDFGDYDKIIVDEDYNSPELLKKIANKDKVILRASSPCIENCPKKKECLESLSLYHMKYTPSYMECPYNCLRENYYRTSASRKHYITYDYAKNILNPLGFTTYLIGNVNMSNVNMVESIIDFMVKEEYKEDARFELLQKTTIRGLGKALMREVSSNGQ